MKDPLTAEQRSSLMAKVRSKDNRSTELRMISELQERGITGWMRHPADVPGRPDFFFPNQRLVLFVDGCFWHACPKCGRLPKTRVDFWHTKLAGNRRRDLSISRKLRKQGFHVMRVWEHALPDERWIRQLTRMLGKHTSDTHVKTNRTEGVC